MQVNEITRNAIGRAVNTRMSLPSDWPKILEHAYYTPGDLKADLRL